MKVEKIRCQALYENELFLLANNYEFTIEPRILIANSVTIKSWKDEDIRSWVYRITLMEVKDEVEK